MTLALRGRTTTTRHRSTPVAFELSSDLTWSLPSIGVARAGHGEPLTERELSQLRLLNLAHLRSEFHLKEDGIGGRLQEDAIEAKALAVPLEVALFLSDDAEAELDRLVEALVATRPDVCRWLVFHVAEWTTSARWVAMARRALASYDRATPIVSGTNANFAELNRGRPPIELLDGVCFAAHPQEHAFDDRSLVETLAMFEEAGEAPDASAAGSPCRSRQSRSGVASIPMPPGRSPTLIPANCRPAWT